MDPTAALILFLEALRDRQYKDAFEHHENLLRYAFHRLHRGDANDIPWTLFQLDRVQPSLLPHASEFIFKSAFKEALARRCKTTKSYVRAMTGNAKVYVGRRHDSEPNEEHDSVNLLRLFDPDGGDLVDTIDFADALDEVELDPVVEFDLYLYRGEVFHNNQDLYLFPGKPIPPLLGRELPPMDAADPLTIVMGRHNSALITLLEPDPNARLVYADAFQEGGWPQVLSLLERQ